MFAFAEEGKAFDRQRRQRSAFDVFKQLRYLLLGRTMNARVGDARFPPQKEFVLIFQTVEPTRLECVALDVLYARLNLSFGLTRPLHLICAMVNNLLK
jgi:hypothetical protein